jgi:putative endonuclease
MWFCYILYSLKIDRYYTGYTDNLEWRLQRHNDGWGKYTKRGVPWKIVHSESFNTKEDAMRREREIKNMKSRKYLEDLVKS